MRTNVSPNLRRRPVHESSSSPEEISPRDRRPHDPENEEDEDTDVSVNSDEGSYLERARKKNSPVRKTGLYPNPNPDAQYFQQHKDDRCIARSVNKSSSADHDGQCLILGGVGVFLIILFVACYLWFGASESEVVGVKAIVSRLENEFTNQPRLSFRIIEKALDKVIAAADENQVEPSAPAILLLMNINRTKRIAFPFAECLANLINATQKTGYHIIHGNDFQGEDPDNAKKKIDDSIIETLKHKEKKVVVITDLHVIPFKAVMVLHSYCDHENAPYKNAVFIMTIDANMDLSDDNESKEFDEAAISELSKVWSSQSEDVIAPLLSRITVSVVALH